MPTFFIIFSFSIHIVSTKVEKSAKSQPFSTFFSKTADFFLQIIWPTRPLKHFSFTFTTCLAKLQSNLFSP